MGCQGTHQQLSTHIDISFGAQTAAPICTKQVSTKHQEQQPGTNGHSSGTRLSYGLSPSYTRMDQCIECIVMSSGPAYWLASSCKEVWTAGVHLLHRQKQVWVGCVSYGHQTGIAYNRRFVTTLFLTPCTRMRACPSASS